MRARVTYWTGVWRPGREALSNEVAALRRSLAPGALVVSLSSGQAFGLFPRERVVRLAHRHYVLFRLLASALDGRGGISHVIGGVDAWHQLRALRKSPILFTVAIAGAGMDPAMYASVTLFAAETEALARTLRRAGVPSDRIEIVPPGVDLERFGATPLPPGPPWRFVFASTPSDPAELKPRGLPLLVELCRQRPDIEVVVPWRSWGGSAAALRAMQSLMPPDNFRIMVGDVTDMASVYRSAHAAICAFAEGVGKSAPNFVIEALASGRPALVTSTCDLAEEIASARAGVCCERSVASLCDAVENLVSHLTPASEAARRLAETRYDGKQWIRRYGDLYRRVGG